MYQRQLVPELMDQPDLDAAEHELALAGLSRLNRWTRNASLAWSVIKELAAQESTGPIRLLDLATGSGDIPFELARRARRTGIELEVAGCDTSSQAIRIAREKFERGQFSANLFVCDVLEDPIPQTYDVVLCSQFLHHLETEVATQVLRRMASAATRRVIVVDLIRSRLNWWQVWFATRMLSRSPIVHFDGPQSIRAAFVLKEVETMARDAGMTDFSIRSVWPCRFILTGKTHASRNVGQR
jgi:2-polyprenyl-3-methyl-5-hydroxy-6-metoxy-1,4-benzoquinol methylase